MMKQALAPILLVFLVAGSAMGQPDQPNNPDAPQQNENDRPAQNRFWQASIGGGHYMVALDRISSISRHQYVLDGAVIVDEVTVDALGQSLARFYHITPVTDAAAGSALGNVAKRAVDRGREMVETNANRTGSSIQDMVVKNYPDTTHARTIEFRVSSEAELASLYKSVQTAWENNRGRKFTLK